MTYLKYKISNIIVHSYVFFQNYDKSRKYSHNDTSNKILFLVYINFTQIERYVLKIVMHLTLYCTVKLLPSVQLINMVIDIVNIIVIIVCVLLLTLE